VLSEDKCSVNPIKRERREVPMVVTIDDEEHFNAQNQRIQPKIAQQTVEFDIKLKHGGEIRRFQLDQCTYKALSEAVQRLFPGFHGRFLYRGSIYP
jgi:hypothetical protein